MSHEVETMAYSRKSGRPWHGLGYPVSNDLSVEGMLAAAHLNWKVEKKAIRVNAGDHEAGLIIPGKFALERDSDKSVLDIVGSTYQPIQNEEAFEFFKSFIEAGHMNMETAGSLKGGRYVWGLAKINSSFELADGDKVEGYLLISQPHQMGKAMIIQFTPIRVVCWNTLTFALGSGLRSTTGSFRLPHVRKFDAKAVKVAAERALGIAKEQLDEFAEAAEILGNAPMTEKEADEYFCSLFNIDLQAVNDGHPHRTLDILRWARLKAPGADMELSNGTAWGALNAVTHTIDHSLGRSRDNAVMNAWFGDQGKVKQRALVRALDFAKTA